MTNDWPVRTSYQLSGATTISLTTRSVGQEVVAHELVSLSLSQRLYLNEVLAGVWLGQRVIGPTIHCWDNLTNLTEGPS